jgi:hypothetical protein
VRSGEKSGGARNVLIKFSKYFPDFFVIGVYFQPLVSLYAVKSEIV